LSRDNPYLLAVRPDEPDLRCADALVYARINGN
jgi:hypothetical protein